MRVEKRRWSVLVLALLAVLLALPLLGAAPPQGAPASAAPLIPGRILVQYRPAMSAAAVADLHRRLGGRPAQTLADLDVQVVDVPRGQELSRARAYASSPLVAYAEPDYVARAVGIPDDPGFSSQWGLNNTGAVGTADADIDAPQAWAVTKGKPSVRIAIVDTGIDWDHPDLAGKVVLSTNLSASSTSDDLFGHGTHVAGIAAAVTNNGLGVAGVGYNASLLNVKVLGDDGSGSYSAVASGIRWAAGHGARVINMSLGGSAPSYTLQKAVNYAWNKGVVIVAAAGNSGSSAAFYPARYANCIAVAATDANDHKASWSNYGAWVDVAAPGDSIFSTLPNHSNQMGAVGYGYLSGTSMASPHVAGLAALVWSTPYGTSARAVRARIQNKADHIAGTGSYWAYGRINAARAVGGTPD